MSIHTVIDNKVGDGIATIETGAESRTWREGLFDALRRSSVKRLLFLACDIAAVVLSNRVSLVTAQRLFRVPREGMSPGGYELFYVPFLLAILYLAEGHDSPGLRRPEKELQITFRAVSLAFLALVCANFIFFKAEGLKFSRYFFIVWYFLVLAAIPFFRLGLKSLYAALWQRGLAQQRALWVGCTEKLAEFENLLSVQRYRGYRIVGVIPTAMLFRGHSAEGSSPNGTDALTAWEEAVSKVHAQLVIVSLPSTTPGSHELVREILYHSKARGIDVEVYSDLFATSEFSFELDEFSGFFRFYAVPDWSWRVQRGVKFCVDILAGLAGSLVCVLLTPVIAAALKLEDGGPVFYWGQFVGTDDRVHFWLKFRTMKENADEILKNDARLRAKFEEKYKLVDDPRVLRVGRLLRKYSIDELPQFFNLLKGDLALVGPRAISGSQRERYGLLLPKLLSVKPGMTGFWQVMGRQLTTYEEKIKMDMFYIDHWSIWLDLLIIVKTFWVIIRADGAY